MVRKREKGRMEYKDEEDQDGLEFVESWQNLLQGSEESR